MDATKKRALLVELEDKLLDGANSDPSFVMTVVLRLEAMPRGAEDVTRVENVMAIEWHDDGVVTLMRSIGKNVTINGDLVVGFYH